MKLKPDDNWRWYFDSEHDRLMLDLANGMLFRSRFPSKMLTPDAFSESVFCVEDAALFYTYNEKCRKMALSRDLQGELILNALVACRFLKPQMPKSWYFSQQPADNLFTPQTGDIVQAQLTNSRDTAYFLIAEAGDKASLCLLAQEQLEVNAKKMILGDAIKIMHDRLLPVAIEDIDSQDAPSVQYANVV